MRNQAIATGAGGILIAVVFLFIGRLTCLPPPPDGNPIGFRLEGHVQIDSFHLGSCQAPSCRLTFDLQTNQVSPASPALACASSSNCFHFNNANSASDDKVTLKLTDAGGLHTYFDYVDGTILIVTNGKKKQGKPST